MSLSGGRRREESSASAAYEINLLPREDLWDFGLLEGGGGDVAPGVIKVRREKERKRESV